MKGGAEAGVATGTRRELAQAPASLGQPSRVLRVNIAQQSWSLWARRAWSSIPPPHEMLMVPGRV